MKKMRDGEQSKRKGCDHSKYDVFTIGNMVRRCSTTRESKDQTR